MSNYKKKGYYVVFGIGNENFNLIEKIRMQNHELNNYFNCKVVNVKPYKRNVFQKALDRIPCTKVRKWKIEEALMEIISPDFLYVRRTVADNDYMVFLREIRKLYPKCKIIAEFFTYPYFKDEFSDLINYGYLLKEKKASCEFNKYIDRIVTYSAEDIIFDIPTIKTYNAVDVKKIKKAIPRETDDEIHMVAVAMFQRHHGYDRIIRGLASYEQKRGNMKKVKLLLAGEGNEVALYKDLVEKYGLADSVMFCGVLKGKALDEFYDNGDIAVGSFGMSRIGLKEISSIKIGEYLAKGLPIVAGCDQVVFQEEKPWFYKQFPNDESVIDIDEIVNFYEQLLVKKRDIQEVRKDIRKYAYSHTSISNAFKDVVCYIEDR